MKARAEFEYAEATVDDFVAVEPLNYLAAT
jgi:hypothetical protein